MLMTFVEVGGLVIVMIIGVWYVAEGDADFGVLTEFNAEGSPILADLAGVALSFFAMTGFENAANVAEETIDPKQDLPAGPRRRHAHRRCHLRPGRHRPPRSPCPSTSSRTPTRRCSRS